MIRQASALFPLNDARAYYAGFGKSGFAEAQWLVPHARHADFATALAALVARTRPLISLVASKLFAGDAQGFSFDGHGIALGDSNLVADDLAAGRLVKPFELSLKAPASFSYHVISRGESKDAPMVEAFRDWVLAEARITENHISAASPP